jgi:GT2 family glycosyltransferase
MKSNLAFILVNWNTKELILDAVHSIIETVSEYSYKIIIVENGSCDGSAEMVKKFFPEIRLIRNKKNVGFARAVNQGLALAKARYIFLLNSDARLHGRAIKNLVEFMEKNRGVGIAGGQLIDIDGSRQNSIASFPSLATELLNKRLLRIIFPHRYPGKERDYPSPIDVDSLVGACLIARREAIQEVGNLDEGYFFFLEETDWCRRMKTHGWRVSFVPTACILHLQGASAGRVKTEARIEYYRSRYRFFTIWYGKSTTAFLKIALMLRLVVEIVLNIFLLWERKHRDRWKSYCRLLVWHLKSCPANQGLREVHNVTTNQQQD